MRLVALLVFAVMAAPSRAQDSPQIAAGKAVYAQFCVMCHGADGKRGEGFQTPIWGQGAQLAKFANARGMLDYMQIMPFNDPTLIDDVQRLAVAAYVLANHGALPANGELTAQNAGSIPIR